MPTFTAIALERLLEPGSRNPAPKLPPVPITVERAAHDSRTRKSVLRPNISPALYATPESTPLPDSPSSFISDSPYLINHKRRGPRLIKSVPENDVIGGQLMQSEVEQKVELAKENKRDAEDHKADGSSTDECTVGNGQNANSDRGVIGAQELVSSVSVDPDRDDDTDDFFDMHSIASNSEVDDTYGRFKPNTPLGEYYDALEEISSGGTSYSSFRGFEEELREMKLTLLMEIQKRKQAEESLESLQNLWKRLSHHLSFLGLSLPLPPIVYEDIDAQLNSDPVEELSQQVVVSRFVADAVARACARAEVQLEMEPQIASKNFELARLSDRLQYYEAANREMSQRNQEAIEMARQERNKRKRRQKWLWSSVCLAITLGGGAIAWSYLPSPEPTLPESDTATSHEPE